MKFTKVSPLVKSGNSSEVNKFRIVSILPLLLNILERLMYNELLKSMGEFNILYDIQFSFGKFHLTIMAFDLAHYSGAIMDAMASQTTSITIVYSSVYSGADQRKHQSSASLAFVWGIHRWPVNSPHNGPVTRRRRHFVFWIGTSILSCLADAKRRIALLCLVLRCLVCPKINHFHTCF